jgi:hypothetical protein
MRDNDEWLTAPQTAYKSVDGRVSFHGGFVEFGVAHGHG